MGIRINDWGWKLKRIRKWGWRLWIGIGDWNLGLEIRKDYWDWGLRLGIGMGDFCFDG